MRTLKFLVAALVLLIPALLLGAYLCLRGSLPRLDGAVRAAGLSAPVLVVRDSRGVPTIQARNRADLAFATGFVHAQDRFFEMDLSRRLAAGELAALFGPVALEQDKKARLFRFRSLAHTVIEQASPGQRALLEAYSRGVNAGLEALRARPFEYWLLGQPPAAWRTEDSILVVYSMWWDLQVSALRREMLRQELNAHLKGPECAAGWKCALSFLYPARTSWDAPVAAVPEPPAPQPAVPPPEVLDVRAAAPPAARALPLRPVAPVVGSNSFAVAGSLAAGGAALVANDMHLNQRVPTIWYHARLQVLDGAGHVQLDLNGVTLPGEPLLVAGSNGAIAWGFTNSYGDWAEVRRIPCSAAGEESVTTAAGVLPLRTVREEILVHGHEAVTLAVRSGEPGLLLRVDEAAHTCWFGSWVAQLPEATNVDLLELEGVSTAAAALDLAARIGIPGQNFVVGDRDGHIGWTIYGRLPAGTDAARARGGAGFGDAAAQPRLLDPPGGRIWTANARVSADAAELQRLGGHLASLGAEYDLGARAAQIRDDLMALHGSVRPADLLRIQLDDRAQFLGRWQELLLGLLDAPGTAGQPQRAEFRRLIEHWDAHASVGSVGYRLVRSYHDRVQQAVWDSILAATGVAADSEEAEVPAQFEGPLWQLVSEQPLHMLAQPYASWREFLLAQVDATAADLRDSCRELAACRWGRHNEVHIRHPLSRALPALAHFLDMPVVELPGDHDMPRVQDGAFGASERFAIAPGHEAEAYLTLPGGQSGHPLSPYYRSGFAGWADGEALPLLPDIAQHTLTLRPR